VAEVIIKIFELFVQTGMTPRIIHILQTSDPQRPQLQVPHPHPTHNHLLRPARTFPVVFSARQGDDLVRLPPVPSHRWPWPPLL
jgi:hypothetical protein